MFVRGIDTTSNSFGMSNGRAHKKSKYNEESTRRDKKSNRYKVTYRKILVKWIT